MPHGGSRKGVRKVDFSLLLMLCLAVFWGGCGEKEPALNKNAQMMKKELLEEISWLMPRLLEPVSKEEWEALPPVLHSFVEEIGKSGKIAPARLVILDHNGITRVAFPPKKEEYLHFYNYELAKIAYTKKRINQAILYLGVEKFFVILVPFLEKDQVIGAIALCFPEEELKNNLNLSEKEFLNINFNK
ncbi:MAG: hypothetical protein ACUVXF_09210 [Desulfobaccales bacterium]